jgi:GLPGLI family protein
MFVAISLWRFFVNALFCTNMLRPTYSQSTCHLSMIRPSPKLLSLLFLAAMAFAVRSSQHAAAQSGTVTYTSTVVLNIELPPEMEQFKDMIPSSVTNSYVMDFNETLSSMRLIEEKEDGTNKSGFERQSASGDVNIKFSFRGSGSSGLGPQLIASVGNLDEGTYTNHHKFLTRDFLVTGELPELAWKLTGEEGMLLDRQVMKATATMDTVSVEAWFSPEIPAPFGPDNYGGLPGLILMLSIDDGSKLYEATSITLDTEIEIAVPDKGRPVTEEEFEKLVQERMEERVSGRVNQVIIRGN